jgi:hypothetical protein
MGAEKWLRKFEQLFRWGLGLSPAKPEPIAGNANINAVLHRFSDVHDLM